MSVTAKILSVLRTTLPATVNVATLRSKFFNKHLDNYFNDHRNDEDQYELPVFEYHFPQESEAEHDKNQGKCEQHNNESDHEIADHYPAVGNRIGHFKCTWRLR